MGKKLLSKIIIGIAAVCVFSFFVVGCSASDEKLLSNARNQADALLSDKGYSCTEIRTEFLNTLTSNEKEYKIYSLTIYLETEETGDYESIWGALSVLKNSNYDMDCFKEGRISIMEYVFYEGGTYSISSLNSYMLEKKGDYKFKYVTETVPHPDLPYVGMSEELISFTGLGEYASRVKHEGDNQHRHWVTYTYYFSENGKTTYIVQCQDGKVTSVSGTSN